eukprot:TRINITY_DN14048_c0_g1_i3.p1 TRINITY_DN14048_c0_g1~~TRINITY_DN14048_c0_g1_i3.p1  ORF type:complete len:502 (-),score=113.23 TRINITY_DN14048_c0_g1_i3:107-1612(-)
MHGCHDHWSDDMAIGGTAGSGVVEESSGGYTGGKERSLSEPPAAATATAITSAPLLSLVEHGFVESSVEIRSSVRRAGAAFGAASSTAWLRFRTGAERSLGFEAAIEEPAQKELWGHVLQVEALLGQLRVQAQALLDGMEALAAGQEHKQLADGLDSLVRKIADHGGTVPSPSSARSKSDQGGHEMLSHQQREQNGQQEHKPEIGSCASDICEMVGDTVWRTISSSPNAGDGGSVRYRAEQRIRTLLEGVEEQFAEHARLRSQLWERQRRRDELERCRRDMAHLQKSRRSIKGLASGLRPLAGGGANAQEQAADRLQEAQTKLSDIDSHVLERLLEIRRNARSLVATPWAEYARIRAAIFGGLFVGWAPVATALGAAEDSAKRRTSSAEAEVAAGTTSPSRATVPPPPPPKPPPSTSTIGAFARVNDTVGDMGCLARSGDASNAMETTAEQGRPYFGGLSLADIAESSVWESAAAFGPRTVAVETEDPRPVNADIGVASLL